MMMKERLGLDRLGWNDALMEIRAWCGVGNGSEACGVCFILCSFCVLCVYVGVENWMD